MLDFKKSALRKGHSLTGNQQTWTLCCVLHFDKKLCLWRTDFTPHVLLNGYLENVFATSMPEAKRWCLQLRRKTHWSWTDHSCNCYLSDETNWICLPLVAFWRPKQHISGYLSQLPKKISLGVNLGCWDQHPGDTYIHLQLSALAKSLFRLSISPHINTWQK